MIKGDISIYIQNRIMFLHCPSSCCHLSINQVSFQDCSPYISSQSPGLRLPAWTFNCITIIPVHKVHSCVHIVKEGNMLRCYNLQSMFYQWHWEIYTKFKATELNWLIMCLIMTVIVRFHGSILWMQANNIRSS